jgi:hypothetical protein
LRPVLDYSPAWFFQYAANGERHCNCFTTCSSLFDYLGATLPCCFPVTSAYKLSASHLFLDCISLGLFFFWRAFRLSASAFSCSFCRPIFRHSPLRFHHLSISYRPIPFTTLLVVLGTISFQVIFYMSNMLIYLDVCSKSLLCR